MAPVNWCPCDQTVLANEQVLPNGTCERCGTPVTQRDLEQWFFRITAYADELLDFTHMEWPEQITTMQRNWIGRSEGVEVAFGLDVPGVDQKEIRVFTTRPDTIFGVTFMVLAPEHPLVPQITTPDRKAEVDAYIEQARRQTEIERLSTEREKTGVFTGAYCTQPALRAGRADLDRGLRAALVRHRRRHGRSGARPARLRVREEVRPAGPGRHRPAGLGRRRRWRRRTSSPGRW